MQQRNRNKLTRTAQTLLLLLLLLSDLASGPGSKLFDKSIAVKPAGKSAETPYAGRQVAAY